MDILLLEDDLGQLRFYQKTLNGAGHSTSPAASIMAAIQLLERHTFDVCVFDVGIGAVNALDWYKSLSNAKRQGMKIIVVTGQDHQCTRCQTEGIPVYRKPISRAELIDAVSLCVAVDPA